MKTLSLLLLIPVFLGIPLNATLNFSNRNAKISLIGSGSSTQLILNKSLTGWDGTLEVSTDPADNVTSRISGNTITFDNGVLVSGLSEALFTGVLDPSGDSNKDLIKLTGHHRFRAEPGMVLQRIEVSGIDNRLEGQPQFAVPTGPTLAIVLADANATLTLNLQTSLSVTISLDDGSIGLANDLVFQDGANIVTAKDGGVVNGNGNRLIFGLGGSTIHFSNTLSFNNAKVELESKSELSGFWIFRNDGFINGHGNLFDLSMGGTIQIDAGADLQMTDMKIGGLGAHRVGRAGGWFIFASRETSTLTFQNVEIELDGNYVFTTGHVVICGPTTIGTKEFSLIFSRPTGAGGTNKRLRIDGTTLWCDGLCRSLDLSGSIDVGSNDQFLDAINCGTIKCKVAQFDTGVVGGGNGGAADTNIITIPHPDSDTNLSSPVTNDFLTGPANSKTMRDHLYLAPIRKLRITQDSLLSGSGLSLYFAKPTEPLLIIDAGVTFSLADIVLKDFSPQHVRYGSATSKLVFGPNVTIELARNDELKATVAGVADTSVTWTFKTDGTKGGAIIKGFGNMLDLGSTNPVAIQVEPNATLTLHHVRIKGLGGQQLSPNVLRGTKPFNLRLMHPESRLVMRGSTLMLNGNYTFSTGKLDSYEDNVLSGTFTFAFTSSQDLTVRPNSRLMLDRGLTFSYDAEPALTVDKGEATKTKIVLSDISSIFHLNGATLHSTLTGVKLKDGTLRIEDKCFLTNEARGAAESAELEETTLNIEVLAGAALEIDGIMRTN